MTDRLDFIRAICTDPADDTVRLVYADWLDEHGEHYRAEFIRVQVELEAMPAYRNIRLDLDWSSPSFSDECRRAVYLRARERELWGYASPGTAYQTGILKSLTDGLPGLAVLLESDDGYRLTHNYPYPWAHVSRGFISQITCTAADWLKHESKVFWHPEQQCIQCLHVEASGYAQRDFLSHVSGKCNVCGSVIGVIGTRPCPPTAQPIERVMLSGVDVPWREGLVTPFTFAGSQCYSVSRYEFTCELWPGIVFEVRPQT